MTRRNIVLAFANKKAHHSRSDRDRPGYAVLALSSVTMVHARL
jgi:hypothetical protein